MRTRYYVLRDETLFIYNNKNQKMPSNLLFLRGMYINQIVADKGTRMHGFCISHESKMVRTRIFYNKNREVVEDWVRLLRNETGN